MPVLDQGGGGDGLPQVPEPGGKSNRPGPGPPGGGPGVSPGSQFGGFAGGGVRPNTFRGIPGLGSDIPVIMRRRGIQPPAPPGRAGTAPAFYGGGVPYGGDNGGALLPPGAAYAQTPSSTPNQGYAMGGMVPGTGPVVPQPQDTADIKATPGEMVMNPGVTSDPVIMSILTLLNILGAHHMSQSPQEESGEQGFGCGGMVRQGYAFGGPVGATGGFGFGGGYRPGQSGGSWQGGATPAANQPGPPPAGPGQPGGSWGGRYTYNPEGGATNVNPADPWGTYGANRDPSFTGQGMRNLAGYANAGYFDPRGNQMLINSMNEGAQGTADALTQRAMTSANLNGLDPAQRAVAKQMAMQSAGQGVQNIMAQTRAQALGSANDFAQGLYGQQLAGSLGQIGQTNQARLQDWINGNQQGRTGGNWGGFLGGLTGQIAGGLAGGLGIPGVH